MGSSFASFVSGPRSTVVITHSSWRRLPNSTRKETRMEERKARKWYLRGNLYLALDFNYLVTMNLRPVTLSFLCCCCSVTKPCPTLCNTKDHKHAKLICPPSSLRVWLFMEFSWSGLPFPLLVDHFCQNSSLWPIHLGWPCTSWLIDSLSYAPLSLWQGYDPWRGYASPWFSLFFFFHSNIWETFLCTHSLTK